MNTKILESFVSSLGIYAEIIGSDDYCFSNIPSDFNKTKEVNYKNKYYLESVNKFNYDGVVYFVRYYTDVTEIKKQLLFDCKTGVLSTCGFNQMIEEKINNKTQMILGIFDIDNFKVINDSFGHNIGDMILKSIGLEFTNGLRKTDLIGRFGGDEFTFVLPNISINNAKVMLSCITSKMRNGVNVGDYLVPITLSIGVVNYDHNMSFEDNLKKADKALYYGKNHGKNMISVENQEVPFVKTIRK